MRRPHLNFLLVSGLLAALLAGIGLSHWLQPTDGPQDNSLVLSTPRALPDFALHTAAGEPYTAASFPDQWQLLFFGFTHCPDVCPNTLALMKQLKQDLPADVAEQLEFVFVSVDPARDTAPVLGEYIAYFDPEFIGVTGDDTELSKLTKTLGIAYIAQKADDSGNYNVDHSTAMVLLAPGAGVKAYFPAPHRLPSLKAALSRLIGA